MQRKEEMYRYSITFEPGLKNGMIFRAIKNIKKGANMKIILLDNFSRSISRFRKEDFEIRDVNGNMVEDEDTIGDDDSIYYIKYCTTDGVSRSQPQPSPHRIDVKLKKKTCKKYWQR